jgi:hypothetical protein
VLGTGAMSIVDSSGRISAVWIDCHVVYRAPIRTSSVRLRRKRPVTRCSSAGPAGEVDDGRYASRRRRPAGGGECPSVATPAGQKLRDYKPLTADELAELEKPSRELAGQWKAVYGPVT